MKGRFVTGLLGLILTGMVATAAEPKPEGKWTLPKVDADKWVKRIQTLMGDGWTVSARGNDIIVSRDKLVRYGNVMHGSLSPKVVEARIAAGKPWMSESVFRFTLQFAPKMTIDEHEPLAAINAASDKQKRQLTEALKLEYGKGGYFAETPEEKERLRAFEEKVAKLPRHKIPDLYTQEHSIYLYNRVEDWEYFYDKGEQDECSCAQDKLLRYFGMYDPTAAARGIPFDRTEPRSPPDPTSRPR